MLKNYKLGKRTFNLPTLFWFLLTFIAVFLEYIRDSFNNYIIFRQLFWHVREQKNLYLAYPAEYFDINEYGPSFSIVIAPFALLPDYIGVVLWAIANAAVLFYAFKSLPLSRKNILVVLLITLVEMMTATHSVQYNPMVAGFLILSFAMVEKEKDFWAAFFIVLGFLTKVYGIAGLTFFLFSKHKKTFVLSCLFWLAVLFCLPMLLSSPSYIVKTYRDWFESLTEKNLRNNFQSLTGGMQDISLTGLIRRIFKVTDLNNKSILLPAALLYALPLLRFKQYKHLFYRLSYLAVTLISVVVLSSSAESPTYVIAVAGVAVWYVIQPDPKNKFSIAALAFVLVLTSLSVTDLFPHYIKQNFVVAYSLKALPCVIVWLVIIYQLFTKDFQPKESLNIAKSKLADKLYKSKAVVIGNEKITEA